MGLRYKIYYWKGQDNRTADALSRCQYPGQPSLAAVSSSQPTWPEEVAEAYKQDPQATKLLQQLLVKLVWEGAFQVHQGIIRPNGRIWLGSNIEFQMRVMHAFHDSAAG